MIADANENTKSERRKEAITAVVDAREKARGMTSRWTKKKIWKRAESASVFVDVSFENRKREIVHLSTPEDELLLSSERVDLESSSRLADEGVVDIRDSNTGGRSKVRGRGTESERRGNDTNVIPSRIYRTGA